MKIVKNIGLMVWIGFSSLIASGQSQVPQRIVSLSGSLTEIVDALGLVGDLVAVDLTSDYPQEVKTLAKVSKQPSFTAEDIASFRPDVVLSLAGELSPRVLAQLEALKIPCILFNQEFTEAGLIDLIRAVGAALGQPDIGQEVADQFSRDLQEAVAKVTSITATRTLFIYARGVGAMQISGTGTAVDAVIRLAGGQNVMQGYSGFEPYSTEALVQANPEVILMFDSGMSSVGGQQAVLKLPGVNLTDAGKNRKVVAMDAALLNDFSMRLPQAILQLHEKSH